MRILVTKDNLNEAITTIGAADRIGFDTESYGTNHFARLFAMQFATEVGTYYFNFHEYGDGTPRLSYEDIGILLPIFNNEDTLWYIHNAKFDLRRISIEGLSIVGGVHCTQSCARLIYNQHMQYSLKHCLKRIGRSKDDAVEEYIKEHKLWEWVTLVGKKTRTKNKFYHKVPFEIMFQYGCIDAEEVLFLGENQREKLEGLDYYENDLELQKSAFRMEERGACVRQDYATEGMEYELQQARQIERELERLSGEPYRNGPNWLTTIFDKHGVEYQRNKKTGNPIFDKDALGKIEHPIAEKIVQYRKHEKYAGTYYATYKDQEVIHANIKLHGTDTGRFSYAEPNLQNVPKEEELDERIPYQVRGCFAPRPDHCFVMVDYDQQEFRMLLDYAGELELIRAINEYGEDVHTATANMVGVTRKAAKTLNFGLLYGMGEGKLAKALGLPTYLDYNREGELVVKSREGREIKQQYFGRLPKVRLLIDRIIRTAENRKFIKTWVGRPLHFPIKSFCYKAPNHLIQGGCGDIARYAITRLDDRLFLSGRSGVRSTSSFSGNVTSGKGQIERERRCDGRNEVLRTGISSSDSRQNTPDYYRNSAILIQVHDELLFEIHKDELDVVPKIVDIMENIYQPFNGMRMTCGVEHSWKSWGKRDVVEGVPIL